MTETTRHIQEFWDVDAATYDRSASHGAHTAAERAAWTAALARLLPPAPARVLDVGAGTGFLSLMAARLGHDVTALDLSAGMLAELRAKALSEDLAISFVEAPATDPPPGPFDAVMERHLTWTLPDPATCLRAWRQAAPSGRLLLFESMWGEADPVEAVRQRATRAMERVRRTPPSHHGSYDPAVRAELPLAGGTHPSRLVELVDVTGWAPARLERLRDVEWAMNLARPLPDRLLGVVPRFVVVGG
jgi:SAM-dependent methyltransferase